MPFVLNDGWVDRWAKLPSVPIDEKRLPIPLAVLVDTLLAGALWAAIAALVFWAI